MAVQIRVGLCSSNELNRGSLASTMQPDMVVQDVVAERKQNGPVGETRTCDHAFDFSGVAHEVDNDIQAQ